MHWRDDFIDSVRFLSYIHDDDRRPSTSTAWSLVVIPPPPTHPDGSFVKNIELASIASSPSSEEGQYRA